MHNLETILEALLIKHCGIKDSIDPHAAGLSRELEHIKWRITSKRKIIWYGESWNNEETTLLGRLYGKEKEVRRALKEFEPLVRENLDELTRTVFHAVRQLHALNVSSRTLILNRAQMNLLKDFPAFLGLRMVLGNTLPPMVMSEMRYGRFQILVEENKE